MYILSMFPYPSGNLHLGHIRNFSISNAIYNYEVYKSELYNYEIYKSDINHEIYKHEHVIHHPLGFDAFGLPAEVAAIERGIEPSVWTTNNIEQMIDLLVNKAGFNFSNPQNIFNTTQSSFVAKTQEIFTLLYKSGWIYEDEKEVWWDPIHKTVLANEQVDKKGLSWRSGAKAERKIIPSLFLRISEPTLKQELIDGCTYLNWPTHVINRHKNHLLNLHDWCINRQRTWGTPIPHIEELNPIFHNQTLDTFFDSSWYWNHIVQTKVDVYVGGAEHATGHLVYARAITHILNTLGYVDYKEPFDELLCQGMIQGLTYEDKTTGQYLTKEQYERLEDNVKPHIVCGYQKMSKSKHNNGVSPEELILKYGAQTLRVHILYLCPISQDIKWEDKNTNINTGNTGNLNGAKRFINRVNNFVGPRPSTEELSKFNSLMDKRQLHLAICELMRLSKMYDVKRELGIF